MATAPHVCHAINCGKRVPARILMCYPHWLLLTKSLQNAVWRHYKNGQEIRKDPTPEYLEAAKAAIDYVYGLENGVAYER